MQGRHIKQVCILFSQSLRGPLTPELPHKGGGDLGLPRSSGGKLELLCNAWVFVPFSYSCKSDKEPWKGWALGRV